MKAERRQIPQKLAARVKFVCCLLKFLSFFLFLLTENCNQTHENFIWAKVNVTGP